MSKITDGTAAKARLVVKAEAQNLSFYYGAFNALKRGTIVGKGVVNNRMSSVLFRVLGKKGVPTHFVREQEKALHPADVSWLGR